MSRMSRGAAAIVLGGVLVVTTSISAFAIRDSGVGNRGCPGGFGRLTVTMKGSGNTWAPGDWTEFPEWQPDVRYFRVVTDIQSGGSGGGNFRVYANDTYKALSTSCTKVG